MPSTKVLFPIHETSDVLKLCKVPFLFVGKKTEALEERHDMLRGVCEAVDLVVPDAVGALPHGSTAQMLLEKQQYALSSLGDVEAYRYLPRHRVIFPLPKYHVEAAFPVGKAGEVIANAVGNLLDV